MTATERNIETFRGPTPRCRYCRKPLRPNYKSEHRKSGEPVAKHRRVYQDEAPDYTERWVPASPPDDPAVSFEEDDFTSVGGRRGGWDARSQRYYYLEAVRQVLSRKFLGTFGARADSLFCKTECGYQFAVCFIRKGGL